MTYENKNKILNPLAIHSLGVAIIKGLSKVECPKINQITNEHLQALRKLPE